MSMAAIPTSTSCSGKQAAELDPKKREAILHKMQQIVHEKTMYRADLAARLYQRRRAQVGESGFGLIPGFRLYRRRTRT